MKILETETVVRHHVEFSEAEAKFLRVVQMLPPVARVPGPEGRRAWLTASEMEYIAAMLPEGVSE